jgi:hypothetical protein
LSENKLKLFFGSKQCGAQKIETKKAFNESVNAFEIQNIGFINL